MGRAGLVANQPARPGGIEGVLSQAGHPYFIGGGAAVDRKGEPTGWEPTHLGLYPDTTLTIEHPSALWPEEAA